MLQKIIITQFGVCTNMKYTFNQISQLELRRAIETAFEDDFALLKICEGAHSVTQVAQIEHGRIRDMYDMIDILQNRMLRYEFRAAGELIGYVVLSKSTAELLSFSVNIHHRTKQVLMMFFQGIKSFLPSCWICNVSEKNQRAINWLMKCGLQETNRDGGNVTLAFGMINKIVTA